MGAIPEKAAHSNIRPSVNDCYNSAIIMCARKALLHPCHLSGAGGRESDTLCSGQSYSAISALLGGLVVCVQAAVCACNCWRGYVCEPDSVWTPAAPPSRHALNYIVDTRSCMTILGRWRHALTTACKQKAACKKTRSNDLLWTAPHHQLGSNGTTVCKTTSPNHGLLSQ